MKKLILLVVAFCFVFTGYAFALSGEVYLTNGTSVTLTNMQGCSSCPHGFQTRWNGAFTYISFDKIREVTFTGYTSKGWTIEIEFKDGSVGEFLLLDRYHIRGQTSFGGEWSEWIYNYPDTNWVDRNEIEKIIFFDE